MLTTLRIKNLALVADLTLDLRPGYNAITGETGAGKSILIGALDLALGERADRTLIRSGCESCSVEAVFNVRNLRAPVDAFLADNGLEPCSEDSLLVKRTFTAAGSNRQFVNGSPTTLAALATLGRWLVDIHGPHDHQSLLHAARQLELLDAFGGLATPRAAFADLVRRRAGVEAGRAALIVDDQTHARELDLLRFQVNDIHAARLRPEEEAAIEAEHRVASNAARLIELSQTALGLLNREEMSAAAHLAAVGRTLQELKRLDPGTDALVALQEQAASAVRELQDHLDRYADKLEVDPARLRQLEERLDLVHALKRKYGATVEAVIAFGEAAAQKLQSLEQRGTELARLDAESAKLDAELSRAGRELSARRRKVIPKFSRAVTNQLADLGFQRGHFDVALNTAPAAARPVWPVASSGLDTVEFQFAPNVGEPPRALRAIASSGELARVMLALKTVLAAQDDIPVLVFDEVDANIGGETAKVVGAKMSGLGAGHQVLCVTHLAPVAAAASAHYVVTKDTRGDRTVTDVRLLEGEARVRELARMLGGQTAAARRHAEEMLRC